MERDDNTFLTGSYDNTLKIWNTTTCECLDTLQVDSSVYCLVKTKDNSRFLCGSYGGTVEMRRVSELGVLSSFKLHGDGQIVISICELQDGSFVSAAREKMKRWDENGTVLQTFTGHSKYIVSVIEMNRDIIVSASIDTTVKMWKVSTGECLRTLTLHSSLVYGLERVNGGVFASVSWKDRRIAVWNEKGDCIETHQSKSEITAMTTLRDGSIVTADRNLIEIRQTSSSLSLTHKCAKVIGKNATKEDLEALADVIPEELHRMCLMYHECNGN